MVAEVMHGVALIPGLHSPGPSYALPEMCFKNAKQATKTGKPTWGPPPRHDSQKLSRARIDEVRYVGPHHMREFMGHFSPGPQYTLPGGIGGAPGNAFKSAETLQKLTKKFAPKRTVTLSPTQLGFEPLFAPPVQGSFADPSRAQSAANPGKRSDATFWNQATVQRSDEALVRSPLSPMSRKPWTEAARGPPRYGDIIQSGEGHKLRGRSRAVSPTPYRMLPDAVADPPLANVFGSVMSHDDFGQTGGMGRAWRESKVLGASVGAVFGPPPKTKVRACLGPGVESTEPHLPLAACNPNG